MASSLIRRSPCHAVGSRSRECQSPIEAVRHVLKARGPANDLRRDEGRLCLCKATILTRSQDGSPGMRGGSGPRSLAAFTGRSCIRLGDPLSYGGSPDADLTQRWPGLLPRAKQEPTRLKSQTIDRRTALHRRPSKCNAPSVEILSLDGVTPCPGREQQNPGA